jgi:hypothetical protein
MLKKYPEREYETRFFPILRDCEDNTKATTMATTAAIMTATSAELIRSRLAARSQKIASRRVHCFVTILDGLPDRSPMYITTIPPIVNALAKIRPIVEESIGTLVV